MVAEFVNLLILMFLGWLIYLGAVIVEAFALCEPKDRFYFVWYFKFHPMELLKTVFYLSNRK